MDTNLQRMREDNKVVAVLSTDLSAAFDTVDSILLMTKLEHIGIRDKEHNILKTYLTDRDAYTDVQGFFSKLKKQPDCSVIQGGKLSSTLYTLYTIDVTEIKEIMKSNEAYREIVDEDMSITEQNDTESTGYIDHVNHVVSTNTKEDLEIELNQIYNL